MSKETLRREFRPKCLVGWVLGHCALSQAPSSALWSIADTQQNPSIFTFSFYKNPSPFPPLTTILSNLQYSRALANRERKELLPFLCKTLAIMKMMGRPTIGGSKRRLSSRRGLGGALREQRAKIYIIKRCVVMLLCWHD